MNYETQLSSSSPIRGYETITHLSQNRNEVRKSFLRNKDLTKSSTRRVGSLLTNEIINSSLNANGEYRAKALNPCSPNPHSLLRNLGERANFTLSIVQSARRLHSPSESHFTRQQSTQNKQTSKCCSSKITPLVLQPSQEYSPIKTSNPTFVNKLTTRHI